MAGLAHAKAQGAVRILWGLLVASILIPSALLAVAAWQSRAQALADARLSAQRTTQTLLAQVQNVFETYELVMDRVEDRIARLTDEDVHASQTLHRTLQNIVRSYEQIGSLWVLDANGRALNNSLWFPAPQSDLADFDFMQVFKGGQRGTFISHPGNGRITGRSLINVSRPVIGSDGQLRGVIVVSAYPGYFRDHFARAAPALNYSAAIVRSDGVFLARDASAGPPVDGQHASGAFMQAVQNSTDGQYTSVSTIDGVQRVVSYRKLAKYPVYVIFGLGTDSVFATWQRQSVLFAAFAIAAMFGLASMTYFALARTRRARQAVHGLMEETFLRKQTEAKLVTAQRMEALGQLTGGIAHDFNNLLTVVMGNLDLLRRAKEDRRARLIDNGLHAVEQGRRLTQQLLAFGRRQNLRPEIVDVNRLIAGMGDMLTQSLRGDIKLELDLATEIWPVEVDPVQLQTTLINLAVNARDAMPRGGKFVVRTSPSVLANGQGVSIAVSDSGEGMSPDVLERAFEPFFTTKDIGRGTGLGLSQVFGFIEQSGGTIDISSEVGRGTSVTLVFPRAHRHPVAHLSNVAPFTAPRVACRLLLVEDNAQVRELARAILVEEGHAVIEAGQADQALEILKQDERIDLVLSDLVMPGDLNGLDLARIVREQWPRTPVVLASGYSEAAAKVVAEGFVLIAKPYRPDILTLTVAQVLSEARPAERDNVISLSPR
ncbi:MAG: hybrid sensor histidine kinase/response regulator [Hyphomicrobiales bacterium]|nr:hybrid sensor histidine kinase/response regulator [Hyphomicrobiales bacterium]